MFLCEFLAFYDCGDADYGTEDDADLLMLMLILVLTLLMLMMLMLIS